MGAKYFFYFPRCIKKKREGRIMVPWVSAIEIWPSGLTQTPRGFTFCVKGSPLEEEEEEKRADCYIGLRGLKLYRNKKRNPPLHFVTRAFSYTTLSTSVFIHSSGDWACLAPCAESSDNCFLVFQVCLRERERERKGALTVDDVIEAEGKKALKSPCGERKEEPCRFHNALPPDSSALGASVGYPVNPSHKRVESFSWLNGRVDSRWSIIIHNVRL